MNFKSVSLFISYIFTGGAAVVIAIYASSQLLRSAHSESPKKLDIKSMNKKEIVNQVAETIKESTEDENNNLNDMDVKQGSKSSNFFLEPYNYDPRGRRDPFVKIGDYAKGQQLRPLMPLERFELEDIKLIGIIWDVQSPKAMFMDPESQVYMLSKNQRIGRNQGYIAVIREGEVVVVETNEKNNETVYESKIVKITE